MLLTLLRHAERVRMACIAQVVNVLAPLMTETGGRMWKQTTWYPLEHASRFGRGEVVFATESGPDIDSERYGPQPAIESIVTRDPENGTATLFSINRSMDAAVPMSASMNSSRKLRLDQALRLQAIEPSLVNTAGEPDRVVPVTVSDATFADNRLDIVLPPLSWNVFRFAENGS
jgi:alpha-N-arabinofuranosidase